MHYILPNDPQQCALPISMMTKESINHYYKTMLRRAPRGERRVFHAMFATAIRREGVSAFIAKRTPKIRTQVKTRQQTVVAGYNRKEKPAADTRIEAEHECPKRSEFY